MIRLYPRRATPLAALALAVLAGPAWAQPWWNPSWLCRRMVEVEWEGGKRPGEEAVFVEFPTGGYLQPDGRDLRVLAGDKETPREIISLGPGDRVSLVFQPVRNVRQYALYYGNPAAPAPKYNWTPNRGLLLETRHYKGGECRNWAEMRALIEKSGPAFGRGFVETLWHGHNPFGPSRNFVSIYKGWMNIPADQEVDLAISSASASFFFLDGQPFLEWPGWHGPTGRGQFHKQVMLRAGLHRIEYYHVQGNADPVMALVWKRPDEPRYNVIPASVFIPPLRATAKDFRLRDAAYPPDFDWRNKHESAVEDRWFITMLFTDRPYAREVGGRRRLWDFGDGVTSSIDEPSHVYLTPGTYTVTLTYPRDEGHVVCKQTVVVDRDWARQTELEPEPLRNTAAKIKDYPFDKIAPPGLLSALLIFREEKREDDMLRVGEAVAARMKEMAEADLCEAVLMLSKVWREKQKDPGKALANLRKAEAALKEATLRARVAVSIGDVIFYDQNKPVSAKPEYERVIEKYGQAAEYVRLACMRLGDIARQLGNQPEARRFYQKSLEQREKIPAERAALNIAMRALETEDYLRRALYEEARDSLHLWQWQDPEEKLRGQWSLLMMKYALATRDPKEAIKEGDILLRVNPESQYAPDVLLLLAEAHAQEKRPDAAAEALRRILVEYRDSPLVKDAEESLRKLESAGKGGKR